MEMPIIEWYKLIPDPEIKKRAINNCIYPDALATGHREALRLGMGYWDKTPEGDLYWYTAAVVISPTWPIPETWEDIQQECPFEISYYLLDWLKYNYEPPKKK